MTVKGISRQVIVVQSPDPKLFDQAIFILKDGAAEVTEEKLLREANCLIKYQHSRRKGKYKVREFLLLGIGASFTGLLWLLATFF